MSKEINKIECSVCESTFKLVYESHDVSGYPKFCSFCGSETYNDEESPEDFYDPDNE